MEKWIQLILEEAGEWNGSWGIIAEETSINLNTLKALAYFRGWNSFCIRVSSWQKLWLDLLLMKCATFVLLFCMKCLWASQNNESICGVVKCHTCKCRSWGVGSWTDCWIVWVLHRKHNNSGMIWCQSMHWKLSDQPLWCEVCALFQLSVLCLSLYHWHQHS